MGDNFKFKNKEEVNFEYGEYNGIGIVVGCSTISQPFCGSSYIIKVLRSNFQIPNETYPYGYITLPETYIKGAQGQIY